MIEKSRTRNFPSDQFTWIDEWFKLLEKTLTRRPLSLFLGFGQSFILYLRFFYISWLKIFPIALFPVMQTFFALKSYMGICDGCNVSGSTTNETSPGYFLSEICF